MFNTATYAHAIPSLFVAGASFDAVPGIFEHPAPWAQHLNPLWQGQPVSMAAERAFNRAMSHRPPNCAVCALFKRFDVSIV